MITDICQRWTHRRCAWRPAGEAFDPRRFEVAPIARDREARAFVEAHHYSGSYPAARVRFGLYEGPDLVGVAVFSQPMRDASLAPFGRDVAAELGRFVLLDRVPGNAESWMLARCLNALRRDGFEALTSFSDPEPRRDAQGRETFVGHVGTIYQASNAVYVGRAAPNLLRLLPDGTSLSRRAIAKITGRERGYRYVVDTLVRHGAPEPDGDLDAWFKTALAAVTRQLKHGGNHKYFLPLTKAARRAVEGRAEEYPKLALRNACQMGAASFGRSRLERWSVSVGLGGCDGTRWTRMRER